MMHEYINIVNIISDVGLLAMWIAGVCCFAVFYGSVY